ncbi:MAG: hypothetical protein MUO60_04970 [Clostridiaceae bacterium]|nr:hypothetical protein [Clostridiaceae bacterium]
MPELILFGIFLFLAVFNAGNMTTLQIQPYGIYPFVGKETFSTYMQANNKSARIPSILPAMLLLLTNSIMLFMHPKFISDTQVILFLALNIAALISTFTWQRKLQGQMAVTGYDEDKIKLLLTTNWIRTILFLLQGIIVVLLTMQTLKP